MHVVVVSGSSVASTDGACRADDPGQWRRDKFAPQASLFAVLCCALLACCAVLCRRAVLCWRSVPCCAGVLWAVLAGVLARWAVLC